MRIPLRQFSHGAGVGLGLVPGKAAPEHADDGGALEQRQVQRQRRNRASGKTHHQVAAAPGNRAKSRFGQVAAHRVVNHIGAFAAGQALEGFAQVLRAVVDGGVGADGLAEGAFFVRGRGCNHGGAQGLGNLDGRSADAAGSAQHQHGFAGLELRPVNQRMVRGGVNHDEGRRIDIRKTRRQRHAQRGRCDRVGGEAAGAGQAGDVLADPQIGDASAYGPHHAGIFGAGHKRQRRLDLVFVLHDQQVGEIQARRLDFDQHFARPGLRRGQFGPAQGVNAGGGFTKPGMHVKISENKGRPRFAGRQATG